MSWFSSRAKADRQRKTGRIYAGPAHSPGFELLCQRLDRRPPRAILDVGPSSSDSLSYLSRLSDQVTILDLFHSACKEEGTRSKAFVFEDVDELQLPAERRFDVVLLWDLLHYFRPSDRRAFTECLAAACAPEALVLMMASAITPIPTTPIHFKIEDRDRLNYVIDVEDWVATPGLHPRVVEQLMPEFEPMRLFQLRNGLQEHLFSLRPAEPPAAEATAAKPTAPAADTE